MKKTLPNTEPHPGIKERDADTLLDELEEIVSSQFENMDPKQVVKNNEAFLQLLDRLNRLKPLYEVK